MLRRLGTTGFATTAALASTSLPQMRHYQENGGQFTEAAFIDRMDLQQLYPTSKPKMNAGEFGYQRGSMWTLNTHHHRPMRNPMKRRVLIPRKAEIVTVIGASGFLGCHVLRELLACPDIKKVRACTRYPTHIPAGSEFDKILQEADDKLELHECDASNRLQINVACNGADTLIHCIDWYMESTQNAHEEVFLKGATFMGMAGKNVRLERIIYVSDLMTTFHSESSYSDFKSRGEDAIAGMFPDATVMRFGPLFGKEYRYRALGKWIYPCIHHDSAVKPVWVKDAARAVVLAARSDRAVRMRLDLGGPEVMTHLGWVQNMSSLYKRRLCFAMQFSLGNWIATMCGWFLPNVIDPSWHRMFDLDAVERSPNFFENIASWDLLEMEPYNMREAALLDHTGVDSHGEERTPYEVDMERLAAAEKRESDAFTEEEHEARKNGVWRAVADPSMGQRDGASELLANEPYPGKEWRMEKLHNAKYPENAPSPGDGGAVY